MAAAATAPDDDDDDVKKSSSKGTNIALHDSTLYTYAAPRNLLSPKLTRVRILPTQSGLHVRKSCSLNQASSNQWTLISFLTCNVCSEFKTYSLN